jgi:oligoendopeptidase F
MTCQAPLYIAALRLGALLTLSLTAAAQAPTAQNAPPGSALATMWDLSDLYATSQDWTASYQRTEAAAQKLDQYRGRLSQSPKAFFTALKEISDIHRESDRLSVYAQLKGDENLRVAIDQERRQQAQSLATLISAKTAWVAPEIIALGAARVRAFEAADKVSAARFDFYLANTLRSAPHTLGPEAEAVLAGMGDVLSQPDAIYGQLADANMPFTQFTLPDASTVRLDVPAYEKYRQVADRAERKAVFDEFFGTWKGFEGTLGATLTTQVMENVFSAKARKFDSARAAAMFPDNMPEAVYRTMVEQTHAGLPTLHRYLKLRKARLGISDELAYYDNYPPMFPKPTTAEFSPSQSTQITLAALAPMGEDYLSLLRRGLDAHWMNLLPQPGKVSGAYMNGSAYDVHPYLLFNFNDDYNSLSAFAHEWGHAVHTLLTRTNQPYEKSNYATFIAESASIGNEMFLNDYLVQHASSKAEKLYFLGAGLETIRTTYFRQAMFAEFESAIHADIENARPLSGARLSEEYCALVKQYYGEAEGVMKIDPAYCIEWAYIPHFYYDFYVWQYATSIAGAAQFTDAILKEGAPARERFLTLLRAGGSDYPYELYKKAGIDMATPAPYQALFARMNRIMDQIEALEAEK